MLNVFSSYSFVANMNLLYFKLIFLGSCCVKISLFHVCLTISGYSLGNEEEILIISFLSPQMLTHQHTLISHDFNQPVSDKTKVQPSMCTMLFSFTALLSFHCTPQSQVYSVCAQQDGRNIKSLQSGLNQNNNTCIQILLCQS